MARAPDDQALLHRHRTGDRNARSTLIERYMPLARGLAVRYRGSPEELDDLIQVASLGLVNAVDRWDPDRGVAFSIARGAPHADRRRLMAGSAARLFVSHRMVKHHLSKVFAKLNIRSRNALDQALTTESSPAPAR